MVSGPVVPNAAEGGYLVDPPSSGEVHNGSHFVVRTSCRPRGTPDLTTISNGTAFLTQLPNDLSQALNRGLQSGMSDAEITAAINKEIYARFAAGFRRGGLSFAIIWLDPVSLGVQAPQGTSASTV